MPKEAYYFSHDSNAHDDPKCILLIEQLGMEGYGIYWLLLELLRDQPDYSYPLNLLSALAKRYNTSTEKITTVVKNYDLFNNDDVKFWSISLNKRMERVDEIRRNAIKAGIKSGEVRRMLSTGSTDVKQPLNGCSTDDEQRKEKKGNKIKRNIYGEFQNVLLSDEEYTKLEIKFNSTLKDRIEKLSEYMASKGKTYKSHYATILNWARKDDKQPVDHGPWNMRG